jgi:hypothetical protein
LRPRCWSGRNITFAPCERAHCSTFDALELVQHAPSWAPQKALMLAAEFTYVIGMIFSPVADASRRHDSST